jgi:hypothetical protein
MRKLSLESLEVESFVTTGIDPRQRGTVAAHGDIPAYPETTAPVNPSPNTGTIGIFTYDARECGETNYMDCTYGCTVRCSYNSRCVDVCWLPSYEPGEPAYPSRP